MPLLSVKNITVRFGEHTAVDRVSFALEKGNVLAVVGPNGSGKTSLLKAILGLIPFEGEVRWRKKVVIGYVPQRFDFDRTFPLTVRELFLLRFAHGFWWGSGRATAEITVALRLVGAEGLVDKRIGNLSGGELQRVLIAYALIGKPDILFFDEPSTGIDVAGEETVYHLIHRLVMESGLTVFLISHDLDIVFRHATEVLCLNRRLICHGVPREALTGEMLEQLYGHHAGRYEHHH
ncbi:metal ABC transporter ATP-binding protein [Candidatus Uhrbacteria bacterium]|nr:metal ABC transporter ATP-binding protein [Candidatus Uhrbacteria bacterium]